MSLKTVQQRLINMGYSLGPSGADGEWGKFTEAAINGVLDHVLAHGEPPPVPTAGAKRYKRLIAEADLPPVAMKRVHIHWTAGAYVASELDKEHYHFVVEGDSDVIPGDHSIRDNVNIKGKTSDDYAAHTLGANTGAIGVSMCCMAGAVEGLTNGKFPMLEKQFETMTHVVAQLADRYNITVTDKTILTHAEVQTNLGIKQRGKWDITVLPFKPDLKGAKPVGDYIREKVAALMLPA